MARFERRQSQCERCSEDSVYVIENRRNSQGTRRRHVCKSCDFRFNTYEISEDNFKAFVRSQQILNKITKALNLPSIEAHSTILCDTCKFSTDSGCSFGFPEYATPESSDCTQFSSV